MAARSRRMSLPVELYGILCNTYDELSRIQNPISERGGPPNPLKSFINNTVHLLCYFVCLLIIASAQEFETSEQSRKYNKRWYESRKHKVTKQKVAVLRGNELEEELE